MIHDDPGGRVIGGSPPSTQRACLLCGQGWGTYRGDSAEKRAAACRYRGACIVDRVRIHMRDRGWTQSSGVPVLTRLGVPAEKAPGSVMAGAPFRWSEVSEEARALWLATQSKGRWTTERIRLAEERKALKQADHVVIPEMGEVFWAPGEWVHASKLFEHLRMTAGLRSLGVLWAMHDDAFREEVEHFRKIAGTLAMVGHAYDRALGQVEGEILALLKAPMPASVRERVLTWEAWRSYDGLRWDPSKEAQARIQEILLWGARFPPEQADKVILFFMGLRIPMHFKGGSGVVAV